MLVLRNTGFGHAGFQPGDFYRALLLNTANKCLPALPNVANDCICFIMNIGGEGGNDSNLLIVFYVQIMPDDLVMQLHRF
ncbi:hypothetical protein BFD29_27375 [Escherichia coli]|nr:hypothetical protein BFD29_27375 [Escherichia coli]